MDGQSGSPCLDGVSVRLSVALNERRVQAATTHCYVPLLRERLLVVTTSEPVSPIDHYQSSPPITAAVLRGSSPASGSTVMRTSRVRGHLLIVARSVT